MYTLVAVQSSLSIRTVALRIVASRDDALSLTFGVRSVTRIARTGASRAEPAFIADTTEWKS